MDCAKAGGGDGETQGREARKGGGRHKARVIK